MPKPSDQSCSSCQYFGLDATHEIATGWCVRYPPQIVFNREALNVDQYEVTQFPVVNIDWWCGEFKAAPPS